jgi:LCP family protein required for cell wall assembly
MSLKRKKIALFLAGLLIILIVLIVSFWHWQQLPPGRTNFLILGIAGQEHQGQDLTDSLIFVSVDQRSGQTLILSLPRDIWIPALRSKLNSVYHYRGLAETKKIASEIVGQPVDHGLVIDFQFLSQAVEILGGVEVEIQRPLDDYQYPIEGKENDLCEGDPEFKCRYEHLHFEAGKQLMNGETALKYVRSRNAVGVEGTDFARIQRQQRLMLAIKDKILSPQFFLHPEKLRELVQLMASSLEHDLRKTDYQNLLKLALKLRSSKIKTASLNNNYLVNPSTHLEKYDQQWVLIPKATDWQEVQQYVSSLLNSI